MIDRLIAPRDCAVLRGATSHRTQQENSMPTLYVLSDHAIMPTFDDLMADIHYMHDADYYRQWIARDGAAAVAQREMQEFAKALVPRQWAFWTREAAEAAIDYPAHVAPWWDAVVEVTTQDLVDYYKRLGWVPT